LQSRGPHDEVLRFLTRQAASRAIPVKRSGKLLSSVVRIRHVAPVVVRRRDRRGSHFPTVLAHRPIVSDSIETRVAGGVISERMRPSFFDGRMEDLAVDPFDQTKPKEFTFVAMLFTILVRIFEEARTPSIQHAPHRFGDSAFKVGCQPNPKRERPPVDVFRDGPRELVRLHKLSLVLGQSLRATLEPALSVARIRGMLH